jgi:phospholipid/cholesterol/gamma-HCH transport system substrate-binding protein
VTQHAKHAQRRDERLRTRNRRLAFVGAAALLLVTIAVFVKRNPFAHPFTFRATFSSAAQLHHGGDVRVAGIRVGRVEGLSPGPGHTSVVEMSIERSALPIHDDARLTIKPRLVLEGNAYVDVHPGSPSAPSLRSGAMVPLASTATTVQLDQVLDTFERPTRDALQGSVKELAIGLGGSGKGGTAPGWRALRRAVREFDSALHPVAQVAHAARGTTPGDARRAVTSLAAVTSQLAEDPAALADIVTNYNKTFRALAAEHRALAESVNGFDQVLRAAPRPLRELESALPALTRFADALRPSLHAAPAALEQTNRLFDQVAALVRPEKLPALLTRLSPMLADLPVLEKRLQTLFEYSTPVTDCIASNIVPALRLVVPDGPHSTGDPAYLDLVHLFTGLTSFSSAVDGNGGTARLGVTTGEQLISHFVPGIGQLVGRVPNADGVRPKWLGHAVLPPFRPDQPCADQPVPNLSQSPGVVPAWATATVRTQKSKGHG